MSSIAIIQQVDSVNQKTNSNSSIKNPIAVFHGPIFIVKNNYSFEGLYSDQISIYDISDPENKILISEYTKSTGGIICYLDIYQNYLFIVYDLKHLTEDIGFEIINITNITQPIQCGHYYANNTKMWHTEHSAVKYNEIEFQDDYVYLLTEYVDEDDFNSIRIINITNVYQPEEVFEYNVTSKSIVNYAIFGDIMYVLLNDDVYDFGYEIQTVNISNKSKPILIETWTYEHEIEGLEIDNHGNLILYTGTKMALFNLDDPAKPKLDRTFSLMNQIESISKLEFYQNYIIALYYTCFEIFDTLEEQTKNIRDVTLRTELISKYIFSSIDENRLYISQISDIYDEIFLVYDLNDLPAIQLIFPYTSLINPLTMPTILIGLLFMGLIFFKLRKVK